MGNLPIGQGLSVTPMQMAAAYSAIANGGILRAPRLVLDRWRLARRPTARPSRDQHADFNPASADARGGARAGRHRVGGQRPGLHAGREDGHRPGGVKAATPTPGSLPRSSASRPRRTRGCWSRWSSTSLRAELLRRHGRRPCLRRDRQVRAALSRDPPGPKGRRRRRRQHAGHSRPAGRALESPR